MSTPVQIDCVQGTREWLQARCGLVTASRCGDVVAMTKKGEAAPRRDYRTELISEILTGRPYPRYVTQEMRWGIEQERFARAAYEMQRNVLVEICGFIPHPDIPRFGASSDGLVGDDGLVQIKCPNTTTHLAWLLSGTIPVEHMPQMLAEMSCTQRTWCDFVSYDPRLPEHLQLYVKRFARDEKLSAVLEREVIHFTQELDEQIAALPPKPQGVVLSMDQVAHDELVF
jgi:putative phage-type endonuclease